MLGIELTNRVALVIGGSRGIGAGVTECLSKAGATAIFTHRGKAEHREKVEELLGTIKAAKGKVREEICDAGDSAETTALVERIISIYKKVDFLIFNVGQNTPRLAGDLTDDQWTDGIGLNLDAAFFAVRAVLPSMIEANYGKIFLIGSSVVYDGGGGAIDYATAKAGLEGMMKYLNRTYARQGILTNVIHPSVIETDLLKMRYGDEEKKKKLIAQVPVGRLGKPEDIGGLVTYLASEWGDFVCDQAILVDGGRTMYR